MSKDKKKEQDKEDLEQEVVNEEDADLEQDAKECSCGDQDKECSCQDKKKDKKSIFKKDKQEIDELTKQVSSLKDLLLRNQAELQNYKRRKDDEVAKVMKYKDEDFIKEFLTILDNFERAIKMDDNDLTDEVSRFLEGFKLIYSNTISILEKFEVKEIDAEGVSFDPDYHHAVLTDHDDSKPAGVVLEVLQKGYMYKDRVIRPAMVKVNE